MNKKTRRVILWVMLLVVVIAGIIFYNDYLNRKYYNEMMRVKSSELETRLDSLKQYELEMSIKKRIQSLIPNDTSVGDRLVLVESIYQASKLYNVSIDTIIAVITVESNFTNNALSSAGARGFMQIVPSTFDSMCKLYGINGSIDDPYYNVIVGTCLLRHLMNYYTKKNVPQETLWIYVLFAYNTGKDYSHGSHPYYDKVEAVKTANKNK